MGNIRKTLAKITWLKVCHVCLVTLRRNFGLGGAFRLLTFWKEFQAYTRIADGRNYICDARDAIPCLQDRTATTPIEPVYFVQDTWLARRLARQRPAQHVDVGSSAKTMALIAQFVPVIMVDIRPVPLSVEAFTFVQGSILNLPFPDRSIKSLSSICVVEHIGLGRYGDSLDTSGTEKALHELIRVLAPGGNLYVSVPVDSVNRVFFNAHRAFTRERILSLCTSLDLLDEQYLYGFEILREFAPQRGFGTGMYHFRRP